MGAAEMKAGQEQEREEETSAVPWSQLEGRRVGTSTALDGSEGPLRAGKHDRSISVNYRFCRCRGRYHIVKPVGAV